MTMTYNTEYQYAYAFHRILNSGVNSDNRTGINTLAV